MRKNSPQRRAWLGAARAATSASAAAGVLALLGAGAAWAGGEQALQTIVVTGEPGRQVGVADAASVGTVTQKQLAARTVYRPGELLEATPGLVVSQHSGEGKANQFYLRGFNLDHGSDLRTTVDGMLVNQRSHSHGQGWTDLNFVIPELATGLRYKKGPYDASEGDFAAAGAVALRYADRLDAGIAQLGGGQHGYRRLLLADSPALASGHLLYAIEQVHNDGPFTRPDDFRKTNGVLRYAEGDAANGWHLAAMAYRARWNATDQIPLRAVQDGRLGRFDSVDGSDGGSASRFSLSGGWRRSGEASATELSAHLIQARMALYSNFSYFLDKPVDGDQFAQPDRRSTGALDLRHRWAGSWFGVETEHQVGLQLQHDKIRNALQSTVARQVLATTRSDHILETSAALWLDSRTRWSEQLRSVVGLRADHYRFDVRSDRAENSGQRSASLLSPKLSLAFGPFGTAGKTELYANAGRGFHSNDARGTVIAVDPKTEQPVDRVTPLARSTGVELGLRTSLLPGLQTALSVYRLDMASELVFVGDAGTTEAGRPSRRLGFELANYWRPLPWLTVDADLGFARARFRNQAPQGQRIPGAVEGVASLALAVDGLGPWFGALQWRWFGPRPLTEDNAVRSQATALLNGRVGYRFGPRLQLALEGFNLANRQASAIDYFYTSRLPGEAASGVEGVHFHPTEPRSFRVSLTMGF